MKVSDLSGSELDWWAAKANGLAPLRVYDSGAEPSVYIEAHGERIRFQPSARYLDAHPLIQKAAIRLGTVDTNPISHFAYKLGAEGKMECQHAGRTGAEAAMRTFVALTYGEELPDT